MSLCDNPEGEAAAGELTLKSSWKPSIREATSWEVGRLPAVAAWASLAGVGTRACTHWSPLSSHAGAHAGVSQLQTSDLSVQVLEQPSLVCSFSVCNKTPVNATQSRALQDMHRHTL